jgi:DNA-binding transcriptional MerR regulator
MTKGALSIGEVAARAGVGIDTVRYYERRGVVPPAERRSSGYRAFRPQTVERIVFVKELQALGFSLDELDQLASIVDACNDGTCARLAEVTPLVRLPLAPTRSGTPARTSGN